MPGKEYSFSVNVEYFDGDATDQFFLKLAYTDANGEAQYATVAEGTAVKGEWVQLANKNYQIPADATNMVLYVETAESTNNFYLDEAIGAVGGTSILGAGESKPFHLGDVNADGVINGIDLALARQGVSGAFSGNAARLAADVDQSGSVNGTDLQLIQDYLLGKITAFSKSSAGSDETNPTAYRESLFIGLTRSDLFGYVGAACPAPGLTPGTDLSMHPGQLQENQLKPAYQMPNLIMITGGGKDGTVGSQPSVYHNILSANGIEHLWHSVSDGGHDSSSVQPHFYNYLRGIFQSKK